MARKKVETLPGQTAPKSTKGKRATSDRLPGVTAPRLAVPVGSASGDAQREAMRRMAKSLNEDPLTILANDYVEPSYATGSIVLDHVLAIGGTYMRGRVYQVHGQEHSGKSTLHYCAAAAYQRATGGTVYLWDFEGQVTNDYLWACGLNPDPDYTFVRQPDDLDEVLRITTELIESGACKMFIFDSVTLMLPGVSIKAIREKTALSPPPGEQARAVKRFLQILQPRARKHHAVLMFVNQECTKIATNFTEQQKQKYQTIATPYYNLNGGGAMRYFPTVMLETSKGAPSKGSKDDKTVWLFPGAEDLWNGPCESWPIMRSKIRVIKNKITAGGFREYHLWLRPGGGIDDWISVRELAKHYDLICYEGSRWRIGNESNPITYFKTRDEAIQALVIDQDINILGPLREQVIAEIHRDDHRAFGYERTERDKFLADEIKEPVPVTGKSTPIDLEEEDLSLVGEDVEL